MCVQHGGTCAGVRSGWSCRSCRVCQVCRGEAGAGLQPPGHEARAVTCEHCDKLYHATCLRPVMATVPKYGWKCKVSILIDYFYRKLASPANSVLPPIIFRFCAFLLNF